MALHTPPKIGSIAKPTRKIRYHIDYGWWEKNNRDLRIYLQSHLCAEHQALYADFSGEEQVDWIDPRTAEVRQVDGLEHTLHTHCSQQPDYITAQTTLINAIFRVFLANGNSPLTVDELAAETGRQSDTIQRTLNGDRIYKGILPLPDEDES